LPQRQASHDIATINHFITLFSEAFKAMSVDLHRNLTQWMQISAFCPDPYLPRTVALNPSTYCSSGGKYFANGGSYLGAN
jgi:hypothetical protein